MILKMKRDGEQYRFNNGIVVPRGFVARCIHTYDWSKDGPEDDFEHYIIQEWVNRSRAARTNRTTTREWLEIRWQVWVRDKGVCQVCLLDLNESGSFHCGHLVDRFLGGKDELDNLVVMCEPCNMSKPCHDTIEQYQYWQQHEAAQDRQKYVFLLMLKDYLERTQGHRSLGSVLS